MSRASRRFAPWALAAVAAGGLWTEGRMAAAVDMDKLRLQAFRSYEKDLASRDAGKRRDAADALGGFEDVPAAVQLLAGALGDTDAGVREAAANSLWELEEKAAPAETQLRGSLADPSPAVRVQAAGALEAIGVDGAELAAARRSVLADGDWFDVALAARDLIDWADEAELVEPLLAALRRTPPSDDDDRFDGGDVLEPLAANGNRAVIAPLMAALAEPGMPRVQLFEALGSFEPEPEGWAEALVAASRDASADVRETAAEQLEARAERPGGGAGWPERVLHLLDDAERDVRWAALDAFGAAGGDAHAAVAGVVKILESGADADLREAAAEALGEIGDAAEPYERGIKAGVAELAAPALLRAAEAQGEGEDLRERALQSYIALAVEPAAKAAALASIAEASDHEPLRVYATRALGDLGRAAEPALPLLERLQGDPEPLIASAAEYGIRQIRSGVATGGAATGTPPAEAGPGAASVAPSLPSGSTEATARLREAGHTFDQDGLYRAINERDAQAIEDFLAAGMSARDPGTTGMPPLHHALMSACDYGRLTAPETRRIVAALLAAGADPNALDEQGNPALHRASSCDAETHRALIAAGADVQAVNATGTAAFATLVVTNAEAAEAMLAAGFRFSAEEAASYKEWLASEQDPVKRSLLEQAGAR